MSCTPQPPGKFAPGFMAKMTECEKVAFYEEALFLLSSGQHRVQVRYDNSWVQYGQGSVAYLERALARARTLCGNRTAITIGRTTPWPSTMPNRNRF